MLTAPVLSCFARLWGKNIKGGRNHKWVNFNKFSEKCIEGQTLTIFKCSASEEVNLTVDQNDAHIQVPHSMRIVLVKTT